MLGADFCSKFVLDFVDPKISLCFDSQLTNPLEIRMWNWNSTLSYNFIVSKVGLTLVNPTSLFDPEKIVLNGVNVTVGENNLGVSGNITMKRCKNIRYASLCEWRHLFHKKFSFNSWWNHRYVRGAVRSMGFYDSHPILCHTPRKRHSLCWLFIYPST